MLGSVDAGIVLGMGIRPFGVREKLYSLRADLIAPVATVYDEPGIGLAGLRLCLWKWSHMEI